MRESPKSINGRNSLYEALFTNSLDPIFIVDGETMKIVDVNKAAESLYGYTKDEFQSMTPIDLSTDKEKSISYANELKEGKNRIKVERTHKTKIGKEIVVEIQTTMVNMEGKQFAIGQVRDITERKQIGEKLKQDQTQFKNIFETTPNGMFIYRLEKDGSLVFSDSNRKADEILGVGTKQLIGKTIEEAFPPLAETEIPQRYREAARDGTYWHTEQFDYDHEKIKGCYDVHAFQTAPNEMGVIFSDITERKIMQQSLIESEERFRNLFKSVSVGIILQDSHGRILLSNEVAEQILEMGSSDIEGRTSSDPIWKMVDEQGNPIAGENHPAMITLRTGKPIRNAIRAIYSEDQNKTKWLHINTEPIQYSVKGKKTDVLVSFSDITEIRKIQDALAESEQRFRHMYENMTSGVAVYEAIVFCPSW